MIVPPFLQIASLRTCFSSENVILNRPEILDVDDEMYFDMESRWIEFVSSKHKIPRLILKVPFDFIWNETKGLLDDKCSFKKILKGKVAKSLVDLPYHDYLQKILNWIDLHEKI